MIMVNNNNLMMMTKSNNMVIRCNCNSSSKRCSSNNNKRILITTNSDKITYKWMKPIMILIQINNVLQIKKLLLSKNYYFILYHDLFY